MSLNSSSETVLGRRCNGIVAVSQSRVRLAIRSGRVVRP
jgi:hypothetical protein